jgi:hypothetical protein
MNNSADTSGRIIRPLLIAVGAVAALQALITLLIACVDGAITLDPLMLFAFLIPPVIQVAVGIACIVLGIGRRFRPAFLILLIAIVVIDLLQATGLVIVWATFLPEALDLQSIIAAYLPLTEFVLVGPDWYGSAGYAVGGVVGGLVFWGSIVLALIGLRRIRSGALVSR